MSSPVDLHGAAEKKVMKFMIATIAAIVLNSAFILLTL